MVKFKEINEKTIFDCLLFGKKCFYLTIPIEWIHKTWYFSELKQF